MASKREVIDDFDVWWKYEQEGWSQKEIADYYGVSRSCIYHKLHPEVNEKYRLEHPEYSKEWNLEHPEYKRETSKQRRLENPEYERERHNKWRQTENGKIYMRRRNADRKGLGYIELNKAFPDSEGHHIDETYIIHIPKELHRSVRHNVRTDEGMEAINEIAFGYITEEMFDKLLMGEI